MIMIAMYYVLAKMIPVESQSGCRSNIEYDVRVRLAGYNIIWTGHRASDGQVILLSKIKDRNDKRRLYPKTAE